MLWTSKRNCLVRSLRFEVMLELLNRRPMGRWIVFFSTFHGKRSSFCCPDNNPGRNEKIDMYNQIDTVLPKSYSQSLLRMFFPISAENWCYRKILNCERTRDHLAHHGQCRSRTDFHVSIFHCSEHRCCRYCMGCMETLIVLEDRLPVLCCERMPIGKKYRWYNHISYRT